MARVNRDSITDQVRAILQRDIMAGRLKPGARIFEDALAQTLGVSKTPLRLALHQLKQDGIVRIQPRHGIYVAEPTPTEVMELIEMREVLEGLAARRAARQGRPQEIERLRGCFAGFTEANLGEKRMKYAAADHSFHRLLVAASGSTELAKTMEVMNMRLHMNRLRVAFSRRHDLVPIHREHLAIIAAIEAGDASKAESLVRRHVRTQPWQTVLNYRQASRASEGDAA